MCARPHGAVKTSCDIRLDFRRVRSIAVCVPRPVRMMAGSSPPRSPLADRGVVAVTARIAPHSPGEHPMTKTKSIQTTGTRASTVARDRTAAEPGTVKVEPAQAVAAAPAPVRRPTKQAIVIGLLQRKEGATLADLVAATGWLPHTTRAALT